MTGATAAAEDASLAAVRATVRLHSGGHSGTGFFVRLPAAKGITSQLLLATAAHAFGDMSGPACTAVCRTGRPGGGWERREVAVPLRDGDDPRWVRHPTADVAVIACELPPDLEIDPFPLDRLATAEDFETGKVVVGRRVRVACYPAQTEANAGWPVLRTGAIASHPLAPAGELKRFFTDYSHFGGDSGAAVVMDEDDWLVVGVVVEMQRQTDRIISPFEEKTIHTPLGLAITVPSTCVRETIVRWQKASH